MGKNGILTKLVTMTAIITFTAVLLLPVAQASAAYWVLSVGSRGSEVSRLQQELKNQGFFTYPQITGYYGSITRDAVIRFQRNRGLLVDGIAGNQTQTALYGSASRSGGSGSKILKYGMRGQAVTNLQNALKQIGYFYTNSTGYYGLITQQSVINFQRDYGLRIDGIAGPQTQNALYGNATANAVSRGSTSNDVQGDLYWLARIIHAESAGEPYEGKVAVGSVIMNRVKSDSFPNTIYGVIFEYYKSIPQFSPVADGTIYNNPSSESRKAAEAAYNGAKPVGDALYFFNPAKAAGSWIVKNRKYVATIADHVFYQ